MAKYNWKKYRQEKTEFYDLLKIEMYSPRSGLVEVFLNNSPILHYHVSQGQNISAPMYVTIRVKEKITIKGPEDCVAQTFLRDPTNSNIICYTKTLKGDNNESCFTVN